MRAGIGLSAFVLPCVCVAACFSNTPPPPDAGAFFFDEAGASRDSTTLGDVVVPPPDGAALDASRDDASDAHTEDSTTADSSSDATADHDAHDADADAASPTYAETVMADDPLSYWRFGETSGTVAADSAGTTPGTYTGGFTLGADGAIAGDSNKAVTFDGTSGYAAMGDVFNFAGTTSMSLELWLKPAAADTSFRRVISKEALDGNGREGYLLAYEGSNYLSFERFESGVETAIGGSITPNVYSHIVATFDGTTMILYVDGAVVESSTAPQSIATFAASFNVATYSTQMTNDCVEGTFDEVAVYDHPLSAARVLAHYRVGTGM